MPQAGCSQRCQSKLDPNFESRVVKALTLMQSYKRRSMPLTPVPACHNNIFPTQSLLVVLSILHTTEIRPHARVDAVPHAPIQTGCTLIEAPIFLPRHLISYDPLAASDDPPYNWQRAECLLPSRRSWQESLLLRQEDGGFDVCASQTQGRLPRSGR